MDLAKNSVLNEKMRIISQGTSSQSDILVSKYRGRSNNHALKDRD